MVAVCVRREQKGQQAQEDTFKKDSKKQRDVVVVYLSQVFV